MGRRPRKKLVYTLTLGGLAFGILGGFFVAVFIGKRNPSPIPLAEETQLPGKESPQGINPPLLYVKSQGQATLQETPEEKVIVRQPTSTPTLFQGREVMGEKNLLSQVQELPSLNQPSPEWTEKSMDEFLRFMPDGTEVLLSHQKGLLELHSQGQRYLEHVHLTVRLPEGKKSSFEALVNSETGEVIHTWNATLHEGRPSLRLVPKEKFP